MTVPVDDTPVATYNNSSGGNRTVVVTNNGFNTIWFNFRSTVIPGNGLYGLNAVDSPDDDGGCVLITQGRIVFPVPDGETIWTICETGFPSVIGILELV